MTTFDANAAARATELIMLAMRTAKGLTEARFSQITGHSIRGMLQSAMERLEALKLVVCDSSGVRLTDQGVFVADEVIGELVREVS